MAGSESAFDRRLPALRRRQIGRILRGTWGGVPESKQALALLWECLAKNDGRLRRRLLESPLLGGWVQDILFWTEVRALAERMLRGEQPRAAETRLFDRIARTEFLTELVPSGRLDRRFPGRVLRRAERSLRERMGDLPRILVPYLPDRGKREVLPIFFREIPDEGSPARRVRLGESALALAWRRGSPPASLRVRREGRTLFLPSAVAVAIHDTIPGTSILLAHRLLSRAASMRVGGPVPGLGERLARALSAVDAAWPGAGREIRRRTWLLVPLVEPGTVSYSHLARPGISYINVFRGSLLDLADDLLHETAHHRLHAWQEVEDFIRDPGETRFYSPWRRSMRPLNGILHGTFTFLFRAELFLRMERRATAGKVGDVTVTPAKRRWLALEAKRELRNCSASLRDLREAADAGLLTPAGRRLAGRMIRRLQLLKSGILSAKLPSSIL
jgi:HEXXH motif-containing protein